MQEGTNHIIMCAAGGQVADRFRPVDCRTVVFDFESELTNAGKWKNIHRILAGIPVRQQDWFWFPDPDLEFDIATPLLLFETARRRKLPICQPALTRESWHSHHHTLQIGDEVREVPFCEIMMPCFSFAALKRNYWTFDLNYSGFGIDHLWGLKEKCYVLDMLLVHHACSPGYHNTATRYGFPDPNKELAEVRRLYL